MTKYYESKAQKKRRKENEKEKRQLKKQQESPTSRELRIARNREATLERRRKESPESRKLRLARQTEMMRKRRLAESPTSRELRLARQRENTRKRRQRMTFAEIKTILKSYLARKSEFDDPKEKKNAVKHVLEDLKAEGALTDSITVKTLKAKLCSLVNAYKTSKDTPFQLKDFIKEPESPKSRELRLVRNRDANRERRRNESPESRKLRLARHLEAIKKRQREVSPTSRELRLARKREENRERRRNESPESRKLRLARQREENRVRRRNESPESRKLRLARQAEAIKKRRRDESPTSRELWLARKREENRERRRRMTFAETKAFLQAYLARKSEFDDPEKRENAMKNVLEGLIAQGALTDSITVTTLKAKLCSLVNAYKSSKGTPFPHKDLIHEIFGGSPSAADQVEREVDESMASTLSSSNQTNRIEASETSDEESTSGAESPSAGQQRQKINLEQSAKEWYNDRKIILLKNYRQAKAKRHEAFLKEKEKSRRERHIDMMQEIRRLIDLMK